MIARIFAALAIIFVILWLASLALIQPARAHSWYPATCCSIADCSPIPESDVEVTPEGYRVRGLGGTVPADAANSSPDGQYHVCHKGGTDIRQAAMSDALLNHSRWCLWIPEGGT